MSEELFSIIFFFIVIGTPFCGGQQYIFIDKNEYFCQGTIRQFPEIKYDEAQTLRCYECQIDHFDNETFPYENNLTSFNVSNSGIKYVAERSFEHFCSLQYLFLHKNQIGNISKGAFEGLSMLYELHLESNLLETIESGTLSGVTVDFVNISDNTLEYLPAHAFEGIVMLLNLDLSRNQLTKLHKDCFEGLNSLEILDLSYNLLCHLPSGVFKSLPALKHLNLANNKFKRFGIGTFAGLTHINYLSLAQNDLSVFQPLILLSINYLKELDVSSNNIRNLNIQNLLWYVPTLQVITLEDNIFTCDTLATAIHFSKIKSIKVQNKIFRFDCLNIGGIACTKNFDLSSLTTLYSFLEQSEKEAKLEESFC